MTLTFEINWQIDNGDVPCTNEAGIVTISAADPTSFIDIMVKSGAKKIWADSAQVTLEGTPAGILLSKTTFVISNFIEESLYRMLPSHLYIYYGYKSETCFLQWLSIGNRWTA